MAQCGFTATSAYYLNNTTHVHTQSAHAKAYATTCIIFLDIFLVGSVKRFDSSRSSKVINFGATANWIRALPVSPRPIYQLRSYLAQFQRYCKFFCARDPTSITP